MAETIRNVVNANMNIRGWVKGWGCRGRGGGGGVGAEELYKQRRLS